MAFSADELRVLRGALAAASQSQPATREFAELAASVEETVREGSRLRSFLLADLARYRDALPGSAAGYLDQLQSALGAGYLPRPDDLAALRSLSGDTAGEAERARRTTLLHRCERLAGGAVRARLLVLPGARSADGPDPAEEPEEEPAEKPEPKPGREPSPQEPNRPTPTPAEVFPPRRRTSPPPEEALSA
jgi:hypothetical protein